MSTDQEIKSNVDGNKSCGNCKYYTYGYGLAGSKPYPAIYISCELKKNIAKQCKAEHFSRWKG